jgi:hypothetical protein
MSPSITGGELVLHMILLRLISKDFALKLYYVNFVNYLTK